MKDFEKKPIYFLKNEKVRKKERVLARWENIIGFHVDLWGDFGNSERISNCSNTNNNINRNLDSGVCML